MINNSWDAPEHWRKRARETVAKANSTSVAGAKEKLLKIADEYEEMARRAESKRDPMSSATAKRWLAGSLKPPR